MKKLIFIFLSISYCFLGNTQIRSIDQLENKILKDNLKMRPGLLIDENTLVLYIDKQMNKTTPGNEIYKIEAKFHSPNFVIRGVATYDDGYVQQADEQELKNYVLNGYHNTGELAFSIMALHAKSSPNVFMFDGDAVWYRKDGSLLAKGQFDSGQLVGEYVEYDDFGDEKTTVHFSAKSEIMDFDEYKNASNSPIIGDWVQEDKEDFLGESIVNALHNQYFPDGKLKIYTCSYNLSEGQSSPDQVFCDDEVPVHYYKYLPKTNNRGMVEIYRDGELIEKEMVTFISKTEYKSKTIYSKADPSVIGTQFHFKLNTVK